MNAAATAPPAVDPAVVQGWLQKIGSRVAAIRESLHRNQVGVAEDADVGRSGLSALENGQRAVQLDTFIRVLLVLGSDPWIFFGGPSTSRPKRRIDHQLAIEQLEQVLDEGSPEDIQIAIGSVSRWHKALPKRR